MTNPAHVRAESLLAAEKRVVEMIANRVSLADVLDDLCHTIDAHVPGVISTVLLMDSDGKRLWLGAGPRFPAVLKPAVFPWPIGPGRAACGTAAFLKQRVIISDVTTDPRWPDEYRTLAVSHGLRASWSEPLISKDGQVLGTFAMYYAEPRIPDTSDLELIEAAGHIALIGIQMERSQVALRESEERLRLVANTAPVMICMADVDMLCTYFNQRWLEFTGRPLKEELGKGWTERVHPEDLGQCLATCTQAFDQHKRFSMEYRLRRHDGEYRWILAHAVPMCNADGSFGGYISSGIDITERKILENEHKLAEDRLQEYERVVEGVEEMIVVVDREYRYRIANEKFLKMRNMTKGQVVARFAHEVLNQGVFEAVVKEKLDECFQGNVVRYEMKYTYPELGERDILVSYFPIKGATGVDRVACIVQDITERKRIEEALRSMNRKLIEAHEEERTRIARELHDDINQRIAVLAFQLDRLKQGLPASAAELIQKVGGIGKQIADLGNDIQALSHRLHSSKLRLLGLAAAVASVCREYSDQHQVEIKFHSENIPQELPDEISLCLFRILQEALQNATKHSGSRHIQVSLRRGANYIELTVQDSGVGFKPEEAIKSRGLGLTSMQERLKLVNGELSLDSGPHRGTTIQARVPVPLTTA